MKDFSKETDARIVIDGLLRQAGWEPADKSQILTEVSVRDLSGRIGDPPAPYGKRPSSHADDGDEGLLGRADYVLLDQRGRPLAVVEAKRSAMQPYTAKQQALPYAKLLQAPFIFLTNGELIYFWDYTNDDARIVNSFYSRRDLERLVHMRQERKSLATIAISEYSRRQGEQRSVRPYQQEAMKALDHAVELGKRRFLMELPTGTGGFLIDAVEYILAKYSSEPQEVPIYGEEWLEQRNQTTAAAKAAIPTLQTYRKGLGERLPDWHILESSIYGFDVSRQMMRIAMMNLVLHGIRNAQVKRANALSELGGLSEDDLRRTYKVILSNPPFAGVLPRDSIRKDLPTTSKKSELLFLGIMMQALALVAVVLSWFLRDSSSARPRRMLSYGASYWRAMSCWPLSHCRRGCLNLTPG